MAVHVFSMLGTLDFIPILSTHTHRNTTPPSERNKTLEVFSVFKVDTSAYSKACNNEILIFLCGITKV